jgi:hypothetical protein
MCDGFFRGLILRLVVNLCDLLYCFPGFVTKENYSAALFLIVLRTHEDHPDHYLCGFRVNEEKPFTHPVFQES